MDKEEQRIAIAEAIGWSQIEVPTHGIMIHRVVGYPPSNAIIGKKVNIPDFTSDLNAMHSAESFMETKGRWAYDYVAELHAVILKNAGLSTDGRCGDFRIVNATAAQRAEAFLKTIGKWKDTP